ncbi:hypothetical protein GK011_00660 [Erwinia sp. J316]|uniref:Holin n=1 Tax=Erwinia sorbitola TaxID=2681984 RepID=A0A6I6EMS9_9GAMM|nr:hypothetical protein [Erwinia sorbitola]QGU87971.1 hypothetical protein GN242_12370 [Erwinia sorbitola]
MKFTLFILLVAATSLAIWLLVHYGRMTVVSHARLLFKTWSVWLASIGSMLSAWVQSFPDSALNAWGVLPEDIKSCLPHNFLAFIGAFMVAMAVIAQFIRQKNLCNQKIAADGGKV